MRQQVSNAQNNVEAGDFSPPSSPPHRRKSLRNPRIHYQSGWFFVTSQVSFNKCILGAIVADRFVPTPLGEAVRDTWLALPGKYPELQLDEFQVMPNHFHAIVRVHWQPTNKEQHLGFLMGRFKGGTGYVYGKMRAEGKVPDIGAHLWEFDYWDDMIADERELEAFRKYIRENPKKWTRDRFGACTEHVFGNTGLLGAPRIAFVASQGFPASGLRPRLRWRKGGAAAPQCDREKAVVISTFTSAQEREALKRALGAGRRVIAVLPGGIPPEGELLPDLAVACREGRALLLSPQPTGSALNKKAATWCNEYVLAHADEIWTGDIAEGGMLATLLRANGRGEGEEKEDPKGRGGST